ncbi:hypothetical protein O181_048130 [Austropuccinia psidii MF-1]|uniref:Uncharacterized protein n=1 Tax=Austropuccinia psidii MF-1 TaxID=1389203 RepID=A0A9Q3DWN2_9BASI|nr:hypothetical protein [Austropuccinia psidii MF-1]
MFNSPLSGRISWIFKTKDGSPCKRRKRETGVFFWQGNISNSPHGILTGKRDSCPIGRSKHSSVRRRHHYLVRESRTLVTGTYLADAAVPRSPKISVSSLKSLLVFGLEI